MKYVAKKEIDELYSIISMLNGKREVAAFLTDLLTKGEIAEFSKRWKAARLLNDGVSYVEIVSETGLSSTTVARISKWLNEGAGGYRTAIKRFKKK